MCRQVSVISHHTYCIPTSRFTMRKLLFLCLAFAALHLFAAPHAGTQQQKRLALYGVAFYNLENLFDTIHAPGKNDYEFLPEGSYAWNGMKYR